MGERLWLSGLVVVTGCSWARLLLAGSLKVDESYPSAGAGTALFVVLLAGWALLVAGWRELLAHPPERPRRLAFGGLAIAALMLPMLSNDVYSVLAYGSLAARGQDVYTTAANLSESPWSSWVGALWSRTVCVYGPTTLAAAVPAAALAGGSPWAALALLRVSWLLPVAAVMELTFRRLQDKPAFHAMVWLNPLWLVEGPGQLHADLLGVAAVTAGIVLQRDFGSSGTRSLARSPIAWALWAVAALGKYTFVFTGLWFWLVGARSARDRVWRPAAMAAALVVLGIAAYAPFWHGTATLTEPVRALSRMNPGGSIVEVVGMLVHFARGGPVTPPDLPPDVYAAVERAANGGTWIVLTLLLRLVALAVGARVLALVLKRKDDSAVALGTGAIVVAAITLASHRFESWYLMAALPFFGVSCTEAWRRWWVAAVAVTVTVGFAKVMPPTATLMPIWGAVSTGATVLVFLMSFRARYLTPSLDPPDAIRAAPPAATEPAAR